MVRKLYTTFQQIPYCQKLPSSNIRNKHIYFMDHSEFITGQCKNILSRANKNEIKFFEFGSIKRALKHHLIENSYSWINFNISICFPLLENMTIL